MTTYKIVLKGSITNAKTLQLNRKMLENAGFKVLILWDEMWKDFSELYYEKMFRFMPDEVLLVGEGIHEIWLPDEITRWS